MKKKLQPSELENRILYATLALFLFISIATSAISLDVKWQLPLIFVAMIAILRLLAPVAEISKDVQYLREKSVSPLVSLLPSMESFYGELRRGLLSATETIDLTHIRDNAPADFGARASGWFDDIITWTTARPNRSTRRIICIRNPAMLQWARQLNDVCRTTPQFQVRVVDWNIPAPAVNMAIFDNRVVYLSVMGDMFERTKGLGVEHEAASRYFSDYYTCLWQSAVPLDQYLDSQPLQAEGP